MKRLSASATWFVHTRFFKQLRSSLLLLLPLITVSGWSNSIRGSFLESNGFFYQIYHLEAIADNLQWLSRGLSVFDVVVFQSSSLLICLITAYQMPKRHRVHSALASGAVMLILNIDFVNTQKNELATANLGFNNLIFGFLLGFAIGWIFQHERYAKHVLTVFVILFSVALGISAVIHTYLPTGLYDNLITTLQWPLLNLGNDIWGSLGTTLYLSVLTFFGVPSNYLMNELTAQATNIPTKYDLITFDTSTPLHQSYDLFASFGGSGMLFALLLIIWWHHSKNRLTIAADWSAFPVLVNQSASFLVAIPVFFNPFILIPFLLAPCVNTLIADIAISNHWLPKIVAEVPPTTPGVLKAYVATNGDWRMLLFSVFLLALSILIYLPFVKSLEAGGRA